MIDILRIKPCDMHWDKEIKESEMQNEFINKYSSVLNDEISVEDLSISQLDDFARLQLLLLLQMEGIYEDYITVCFDEIHKVALIKVEGLDSEEFLLEDEDIFNEEFEDEEEKENYKYFPLGKILLNNSLDDPLVHYDTTRNIISLPSKILLENEEYKKAFGIIEAYTFRESENNLEDLLSYNEDLNVYQYDLDESIEGNKYAQFKTGWNYAASQDLEAKEDGYYVYADNGESIGRVFDILDLNLDSIFVSETEEINSNISLGSDLEVNEIFKLEGEPNFSLVYVDEPTNNFALVFSNKGEETSTFLKISIRFEDFGDVIDNCVYCMENSCLYVPIRTVTYDIIQLLYRLGYGWDDNDIRSIGFEPAVELTSEYKEYLLDKAVTLSSLEDDLVALNSIFKILKSETNINEKTINYELILDDLTKEFYEKKKSSNGVYYLEEDSDELEDIDDLDDEFTINF